MRTSQLISVVQREHEPYEGRGVGIDVTREGLFHDDEQRRRRSRHVHKQATARCEDTTHLAQGRELVRDELQAELAEHDVERRIRERQCLRVRLAPLDRLRRRRDCARDGQHAGIDVHAGDDPARADTFPGESRDDTRAARHVEDARARGERRDLDEIRGQGRADGGDEVALIVLRRRASGWGGARPLLLPGCPGRGVHLLAHAMSPSRSPGLRYTVT